MENKDIICPDCECTHIGIQQFEKFGKCASCYMREITSKRKQVPYVKLKELSEMIVFLFNNYFSSKHPINILIHGYVFTFLQKHISYI